MLSLNNVLFFDTEHNPDTYEPECIQVLYQGKVYIIEEFNEKTYYALKDMWDSADAVIAWNALFDIGKLSSMFKNNFKWQKANEHLGAKWKLTIFENVYQVRRIGGHRNLIKPLNRLTKTKHHGKGVKSTPVIDLLKLWDILIESSDSLYGKNHGGLGLKDTLKRHGYGNTIKYTKENAKTEEYRLQDVYGLEFLTDIFLKRVEKVLNLGSFSWSQWGDVKSPATFPKWAYSERYPMKQYKEAYDTLLEGTEGLKYALEQAYNGGITLSLYRGELANTGWVDIQSAYANTIRHFNTDRFLLCDCTPHNGSNWDYKRTNCLLRVKSNSVLSSINKSLKIFQLEVPTIRWVWYDDLVCLNNLFGNVEYEILGGYEFIPLVGCKESLVEEWVNAKETPGLKKANPTLYNYYKFLSNTSYGIKAQRKPFETIHTNMIIAGMITANVHRILSIIVKTVRDFGYTPVYSDTDSCCFVQDRKFKKEDMEELISEINRRIHPYIVEDEGYNKKTTILSLKRYISEGGEGEDKVKVHGKGRYNVYPPDMSQYIKERKLPNKELEVSNLAGNTEITLKQVLRLRPQFEPYKHPFMFITNVETDRSMEDFFLEWYNHIDTKTSIPEGQEWNFRRDFFVFEDMTDAKEYYNEKVEDKANDMDDYYRNWDEEVKQDFEA